MGSGAFFRSNQNTYLLHSIGPSYRSLANDWLLGTTDAFPVFTSLVRLTFELSGESGLAVLTIVLAIIAFGSMAGIAYCIAGFLTENNRHRTTLAAAAVLGLAGVQLASNQRLPGPGVIFNGFGGQYLLSVPGLLQPSDTGVLLLAAAALCLFARQGGSHRRSLLIMAACASITACILHPSYLAPLAVALTSIAAADRIVGARLAHPLSLVATGLFAVAAVILTSPAARSSRAGESDAQEFLSFERVPHHTLISNWSAPQTILTCFIIVIGAVLSARLMRTLWPAVAMLVALLLSLTSALVVQITRTTMVASTFPWRISVVLAPIAFVFIAVFCGKLISQWIEPRWMTLLMSVVGLGLIGIGVVSTTQSLNTPPDPLVAALRTANPPGIGLVPLDAQTVRLNARLPIYVDWKSHPYDPDELAEWIRRVGDVETAYTDDEFMCQLVETELLDWLVAPAAGIPPCLTGWNVIIEEPQIVLRRP